MEENGQSNLFNKENIIVILAKYDQESHLTLRLWLNNLFVKPMDFFLNIGRTTLKYALKRREATKSTKVLCLPQPTGSDSR